LVLADTFQHALEASRDAGVRYAGTLPSLSLSLSLHGG
jgi:hypothetical protein